MRVCRPAQKQQEVPALKGLFAGALDSKHEGEQGLAFCAMPQTAPGRAVAVEGLAIHHRPPADPCPRYTQNAVAAPARCRCAEGHFCPQPGLSFPCPAGWYCPAGSLQPKPCPRFMHYCPEGSGKLA